MASLLIEGNNRLSGKISAHGAKNSALPILAASYLVDDKSVLNNCPRLSDVDVALEILEHLGCKTKICGNEVEIDSSGADFSCVPFELMQKMRSSIMFLGAILAKCKKAKMCLPGGCELGPRPIDIHLKALEMMGAEIDISCGKIECEAKRLHGCKIDLPFPSVGATENILIAAVTAEGDTIIHNAAREPEIADLASYLIECGAKISGAGESIIKISGVNKLHGAHHKIIPDRIEAATFMAAGAITKSDICVDKIIPEHIQPVLFAFKEAGCSFDIYDDSITLHSPPRLNRVKTVRTLVYPGFPTDFMSPFLAMMTVAKGTSIFIETIFQNRFKQTDDLIRMGASIKIEDRVAVVEGVDHLCGTNVSATDLRGGAALIVSALGAYGTTKIDNICHIDRGYENIEEALSQIGAKIKRIN